MNESGAVIAVLDGPPINGWLPTSAWPMDQVYLDRRQITLPGRLLPGQYRVGVKVYWYVDMKPLPVSGSQDGYLIIGTLEVH